MRKKQPIINQKADGNILIITLLLTAILLSVGLGLVRILGREVAITGDIVHGERAYYGAESGVEQALLSLKNNKVQDISVDNGTLVLSDLAENFEDLEGQWDTGNLLGERHLENENTLNIPARGCISFGLNIDTNDTNALNIRSSITPELRVKNGENLQWVVQCQTLDNYTTEALIGKLNTNNEQNIFTLSGLLDVVTLNPIDQTNIYTTEPNRTFTNMDLKGDTDAQCVVSLSNLGGDNQVIEYSGANIRPHAPHIISHSQSNGREKTLVLIDARSSGCIGNVASGR